jgi:hypothetical protein
MVVRQRSVKFSFTTQVPPADTPVTLDDIDISELTTRQQDVPFVSWVIIIFH